MPGVSAGTGVPAYAGIPLTDRRFASQVTFITGHEDPEKKYRAVGARSRGFAALADVPRSEGGATPPLQGTLVYFMGVRNLPQIIRDLLDSGKPSHTPVAVIEWGTFPQQRVVVGTLKDILMKTRQAGIESPALTIIGEVVRLRSKLDWFHKKPLRGKTVLVTRARAQASQLVEKLEDKGAEVLEFPTIEIFPPANPQAIDREIRRISDYNWVVFTSANGADSFFGRMRRLAKDARIFSQSQVAAIGEATAASLDRYGIKADLVPAEFTSAALFESLKKQKQIRGKNFLLARADIAPPDLKDSLQTEGARVTEIEAYRTRRPANQKKELLGWLHGKKIDYITFTSSSTVDHFFQSVPHALRRKIRSKLISIGPVTSGTLKRYGFKPNREAKAHTIDGVVKAIANGNSRRSS